ncbi:hypothetical protein Gotur_000217 [Gossypium turneri]
MFDPWGGYSVIGFGDIILPGLVVAFSLRFEYWNVTAISFVPNKEICFLCLVCSLTDSIDEFCRYDWMTKKSLRAGYFVWAMTAYGLGMTNCKLAEPSS